MNASQQAWVVVADDARISSLVEAARPLGDQVVALVAGRRSVAEAVATSGVDRVIWLGSPAPASRSKPSPSRSGGSSPRPPPGSSSVRTPTPAGCCSVRSRHGPRHRSLWA